MAGIDFEDFVHKIAAKERARGKDADGPAMVEYMRMLFADEKQASALAANLSIFDELYSYAPEDAAKVSDGVFESLIYALLKEVILAPAYASSTSASSTPQADAKPGHRKHKHEHKHTRHAAARKADSKK